jgi:hypothetical protein
MCVHAGIAGYDRTEVSKVGFRVIICKCETQFMIQQPIFNPFNSQPVEYGCETWSLTLREERKLRVSENRVLRIFRLKRDTLKGEWRKLHNVELNYLHSSLNIIRVIKSRRMRWAGNVARMGR